MSGATGWDVYESPIGRLTVVAGPAGVRGVYFPRKGPGLDESARRPLAAARQLAEYFAGERREFEVEFDLGGTPLRKAVWARLREIPYGATISYGELAADLDPALFGGSEPHERSRMVGAAVGSTPTPIMIPCHRVIGADGSLTGYGGGLHRKRILLDLESRVAANLPPEPAWAREQLALL
jgi:methylated-DNA-[protein]-cysteine S-methyltransferase